MIELGGGIFLDNFECIESGKLIIVKKIVGNYTKNISGKIEEFNKITISVNEENGYKINVNVKANKEFSAEGEKENLFFALNDALEGITTQIDQ
jgi:hypothetical protein